MITLLELLLKKKYTVIIDSSINNIQLPKSVESESIVKQDNTSDDDWDTDDFVPLTNPHILQEIIKPSNAIEDKIKINIDIKNDININYININDIKINDIKIDNTADNTTDNTNLNSK